MTTGMIGVSDRTANTTLSMSQFTAKTNPVTFSEPIEWLGDLPDRWILKQPS
jgi:hypothetical protein